MDASEISASWNRRRGGPTTAQGVGVDLRTGRSAFAARRPRFPEAKRAEDDGEMFGGARSVREHCSDCQQNEDERRDDERPRGVDGKVSCGEHEQEVDCVCEVEDSEAEPVGEAKCDCDPTASQTAP
jgi:hypothetical protein